MEALAINTEELLEKVIKLSEEKKGKDIVVLDVRKISPITDYFVIITGDVPTHTQAIADEILINLKREGEIPINIEGLKEGRWIAIDYGDIIVNIFIPEVREYYNLEWLWSDAKKIKIKTGS